MPSTAPLVIPAERSESGDLVQDLERGPGSALCAARDDEAVCPPSPSPGLAHVRQERRKGAAGDAFDAAGLAKRDGAGGGEFLTDFR